MQEMRATTLRIEKFNNKIAKSLYEKITEQIHKQNEHLEFENYAYRQLVAPEYHESMFPLQKQDFMNILNMFKNSTEFFVRDGRVAMREKLQEQLKQPLTMYTEKETDKLTDHYLNTFEKLINNIKEDLNQTIDEYFTGLTAALTLQTDINILQDTLSKLNTLTQ